MKFEWIVSEGTLAPRQPTYEPPQLDDVLNDLERQGWEIVELFYLPGQDQPNHRFPRVKVAAKRLVEAK